MATEKAIVQSVLIVKHVRVLLLFSLLSLPAFAHSRGQVRRQRRDLGDQRASLCTNKRTTRAIVLADSNQQAMNM